MSSAITRSNRFARDHCITRNQGINIFAKVKNQVTFIKTLNHAHNQFADAILKVFHHARAFCVTHFLYDYLLCSLCRNATKWHRFHGLFDEFTDFNIWVLFQRIGQLDLCVRIFKLFGVIVENFPGAKSLVFSCLAINGNTDTDILVIELFAGRSQCCFNGSKYCFPVESFLVRHGVHNHQDFFAVHRCLPHRPLALRPECFNYYL